MKPLLPVLVLLAVAARGASAADCAACTATKLCEPHVTSDKEAGKAFREGLGKPDPAVRASAILLFAEACALHSNCRPVANALLLAAALKDPDGAVRGKAAEKLGGQDAGTVGPILGKEAEPLRKKLEKNPKGAKEEAAWLANYDFLKGICVALAAMGGAEATPALVEFLASTRLKVLDAAIEAAPKVRTKEVINAMIGAIDRVRNTPAGGDRDATWVKLLKTWEEMTRSGIKAPDPSDPNDAIRFVTECKAWWKTNEKTWK